jgi:predicted nucleic acid-binding protein
LTGPFVLAASVTLSWAFEGEATGLTRSILKSLETVQAVVPALWSFEIVSGLYAAEGRGRIDSSAQNVFLERLRVLPIAIEHRPASWLGLQILPIARRFRISAHDAAYLELAIREGLPLATLDEELARAASEAGVVLAN